MKALNYEKLAAQRCEMVKHPELWQFDLLTPQKLWQLAKDLDVSVFNSDTITDLWHVGLLRADLITSKSKIEIPQLELISTKNGLYTYCDQRKVEYRAQGYGGILSWKRPELDNFELLFHPFRLYVLYHFDRVFRSDTSSVQYLLNPEGLVRLAKHHIDFLNRWTSGKEFTECFEHWNEVAEFAIVLEPTNYMAVFNTIKWRYPDTEDTLEAKLNKRRGKVRRFLSELSDNQIDKIRAELCRNAELIDNNKLLHVLVRLMSPHERLKLRSAFGVSMQFLCMAEILRRAMEDALGKNLPEEDEIGFGQWMEGARKTVYGTERITDASRETCRGFLTSMGLDYGVKVRCYVEGETELGALISAVGNAGGTEFVNLRGQFLEKRGKGLSFAAALKNDMSSHIFSIVVLDQDRDDHVRALKKSAKDGTFFGRFFISSPDFEFANFTVNELVDVLADLAERDHVQMPTKAKIMQLVVKVKSGKEFFDSLKQNGLQEIRKSEIWGMALMNFALRHPELSHDHKRAGETRPVIAVARLLVIARDAGYLRSIENYQVDPETGKLSGKQI